MTCRAVPGARRRRSPGPTRARGVDRGPRHGQARECAPHDVQKGGEERCTNRNSRRRTPRTGRGRARGTPAGSPASWEQVVARFHGAVAEVDDPLTWGLDLDEETLTGAGHGAHDPAEERFLRSYVSFTGETLDVETLRVRPRTTSRPRTSPAPRSAVRSPRRCTRTPRRRRLPRLLPGVPRRDARDRRGGGRRARRAHHVPGRRRDAPLPVRHRAGARRGVRAGRGQGARRLGPGGPARAGRRRHPPLRNILQDEPDPRF